MTDPKVWITYARIALAGALRGQELEAELDRLRYDEPPRLAREEPVAELECE
jgi:hypothetical protein